MFLPKTTASCFPRTASNLAGLPDASVACRSARQLSFEPACLCPCLHGCLQAHLGASAPHAQTCDTARGGGGIFQVYISGQVAASHVWEPLTYMVACRVHAPAAMSRMCSLCMHACMHACDLMPLWTLPTSVLCASRPPEVAPGSRADMHTADPCSLLSQRITPPTVPPSTMHAMRPFGSLPPLDIPCQRPNHTWCVGCC